MIDKKIIKIKIGDMSNIIHIKKLERDYSKYVILETNKDNIHSKLSDYSKENLYDHFKSVIIDEFVVACHVIQQDYESNGNSILWIDDSIHYLGYHLGHYEITTSGKLMFWIDDRIVNYFLLNNNISKITIKCLKKNYEELLILLRKYGLDKKNINIYQI